MSERHINIDTGGLFPEGYSYKRICANCQHTWGAHRNSDDLCPGEFFTGDWENSPGTHFKDSGVDALPKGYVE